MRRIPLAREIADRHDLDGSDAQCDQMVDLANGGAKGALWRKGAYMQLVDYRLPPRAAYPPGITPIMAGRVHDLARPVDVIRLVA
jgi:hypothetical protein